MQALLVQRWLGGPIAQTWGDARWTDGPRHLVGTAHDDAAAFGDDELIGLIGAAARTGDGALKVVAKGGVVAERFLAVEAAAQAPGTTWRALHDASDGATLKVTAAGRFNGRCAELLAALFDELDERCSVNLYHSPAGAGRGLPTHYDDHDILAVQLRGTKRWRLWKPELADPVAIDLSAAPDGTAREPDLVLSLRQGDVLFVPRGTWHVAEAGDDGPSVHLACGVHAKRGVDVADWLFDAMTAEARWRRNLPTAAADDGHAQLAEVQAALDALVAAASSPGAARRFLRYRFALERRLTFADVPGETP